MLHAEVDPSERSQELADLQVLERLYSDRHDGAEEVHVDSAESLHEQRWEESSAS